MSQDLFNKAKEAFNHCEKIVSHHAKSFYFCSHFLPFRKRIAMFAIYALCRTLDDIVDECPKEQKNLAKKGLSEWQEKIELTFLFAHKYRTSRAFPSYYSFMLQAEPR